MRMIRPRLDTFQFSVGENQEEYKTLTAAAVRHPSYSDVQGINTLVLAFEPTPDERARLANGEAIYVSLLTFGKPMQPIMVHVGPDGPAAIYGVGVER